MRHKFAVLRYSEVVEQVYRQSIEKIYRTCLSISLYQVSHPWKMTYVSILQKHEFGISLVSLCGRIYQRKYVWGIGRTGNWWQQTLGNMLEGIKLPSKKSKMTFFMHAEAFFGDMPAMTGTCWIVVRHCSCWFYCIKHWPTIWILTRAHLCNVDWWTLNKTWVDCVVYATNSSFNVCHKLPLDTFFWVHLPTGIDLCETFQTIPL